MTAIKSAISMDNFINLMEALQKSIEQNQPKRKNPSTNKKKGA